MRWNDKLRPVELIELDKQAHKMLLACILWHENSCDLTKENRIKLAQEIIEGGLFDYFYRLIITDIKPPVFYRIKENPSHYRQLTKHVLGKLEPILAPLGELWNRMQSWHLAESINDEKISLSRRILDAAHLFASQWEFSLIKPMNPFDDEMEDIAQSFVQRLDMYSDLSGLAAMRRPNTPLSRLANLCGQLRFQIRWTQVPRIPATSVLGHMFIVAALGYFFSLAVNACRARANNNFFSGLLHDLPEVLTRDIISPVKQSVSGLADIIREYELVELERRVFHPLREAGFGSLVECLSYYLGISVGSEFQECCRINGNIQKVESFEMLQSTCNADALDPKDGQMLKVCDILAAFLEAYSSVHNGVSSPHLLEACTRLKIKLCESPLECLGLGALLADFD